MLTRIAFQGERGSFAEEAAEEFFAGENKICACPTLADLRRQIETKSADYAVLPIENSLIGKVEINHQFLQEQNWRSVGELFLPISLNLIGLADADLEEIKTVESHPAALAQCRAFFEANRHLMKIETDNTAASVNRVVKNADKTRAAVGSRRAAEIFGAKILQSEIQDKRENYTRFLLLTKN